MSHTGDPKDGSSTPYADLDVQNTENSNFPISLTLKHDFFFNSLFIYLFLKYGPVAKYRQYFCTEYY